jgi:hypothetical protein
MTEYIDENGQELIKGEFYISLSCTKDFVYFTGEYRKDGLPIFENGAYSGEHEVGEKRALDSYTVKRLYNISKQEAIKTLKELKKQTNWLEKKLKE